MENRSKVPSSKKDNEEFFKKQSDKKKDSMSCSGKNSCKGMGKRDNLTIPPIQNNENRRQLNVGNDPGRGTGQVGKDAKKDQFPGQIKQFSKGTMY